jgi:hypothetical protein
LTASISFVCGHTDEICSGVEFFLIHAARNVSGQHEKEINALGGGQSRCRAGRGVARSAAKHRSSHQAGAAGYPK